jgi:hypothetical protein
MDVIYHLMENAAFENHMHTLFGAARRFVIIYSSDFEDPKRSDGPRASSEVLALGAAPSARLDSRRAHSESLPVHRVMTERARSPSSSSTKRPDVDHAP